jgi:thiol-disulfide isomerase/thioredoxin
LPPCRSLGAAALGALLVLGGTAAEASDDDRLLALVRWAGFLTTDREVFKPASDFTYREIRTDEKTSLRKDYAGRVVFANFWATWCPPCRAEMPSLQKLHQEFERDGFAVLGVNVRELGGGMKSRAFAKELGLTFPILEGPRFGSPAYDASPIPQTYIVDRQGRVLGRRPGGQDWTTVAVRSLVRALLDVDRPGTRGTRLSAPSREGSTADAIVYAYLTDTPPALGTTLRERTNSNMAPAVSEFAGADGRVSLFIGLKHVSRRFDVAGRWIDPSGHERKVVQRTHDQTSMKGGWTWLTLDVPLTELEEPGPWRVQLSIDGAAAGEYRFSRAGR